LKEKREKNRIKEQGGTEREEHGNSLDNKAAGSESCLNGRGLTGREILNDAFSNI